MIAKDIESCLKGILGDECGWTWGAQSHRRKDRTRIWRITASEQLRLYKGKIYKGYDKERLQITRDNWKDDELNIYAWEYLVLEYGPSRLEQELRTALAECGHAVNVEIGRNGARDATITVIPIGGPIKKSMAPDAAILAELGSLAEDLTAPIAKLNDLQLRLRSLTIALNLKSQ